MCGRRAGRLHRFLVATRTFPLVSFPSQHHHSNLTRSLRFVRRPAKGVGEVISGNGTALIHTFRNLHWPVLFCGSNPLRFSSLDNRRSTNIRISENVELVAAARGELGNNRALVSSLEPVQSIRQNGVLLAG